jgi:hypothetical protein
MRRFKGSVFVADINYVSFGELGHAASFTLESIVAPLCTFVKHVRLMCVGAEMSWIDTGGIIAGMKNV